MLITEAQNFGTIVDIKSDGTSECYYDCGDSKLKYKQYVKDIEDMETEMMKW